MGLTFSGGFRVFVLLLWSGLSAAMITIGVMYKDKCLLQPVVPFYLIVAGASYLMEILLVSLNCFCRQLFAVLKVFLLVFILCWLIAGSVWIFPIYFMYSVLCNSVLYQFAFGVLVFQYISIVIFFVTFLFAVYFTGLKERKIQCNTASTMAGDDATPRSGSCCTGSITIQSIIFGIWTPISIALIVVGAVHKNDCAAEPYIPIYMIVAGAFFLGFWLLLPLECCCPTLSKIVSILVGLFLFAWFIAGSVWVFRIYSNNERDCHTGTYLFAFSILIIQWIFIGIGIIATLIGCLCCQNSCASNTCGGCESCLDCCQCMSCLQSCSCLESGCGCMQCCDSCQSLCCCCKSVQCTSCLNCSMCAQCCRCLECCAVKA